MTCTWGFKRYLWSFTWRCTKKNRSQRGGERL